MLELSDGGLPDHHRPPDLDSLIRAVADLADRSAFGVLFDYYAPKLKAFLLRTGIDPASSEELVQEVMLIVWQQASSFDPSRATLSTWIYTIARNRRIDLLRSERRIARQDAGLVADEPVAPSTDGLVEARDWHSWLGQALERLPPEQSRVLRLAFFEDMSQTAIARADGLPLGTVKSRMRAALRQLRWLMERRA